jgi:predicted nuclease of predicted toxin-antitoxin system
VQQTFEIWLDAHLSSILTKLIKEDFGYTCKSSFILNLHGLDDEAIYQKAKEKGYVIFITKDSDFLKLVHRLGSPPKVIVVKAENMKSRYLYPRLKPHLERSVRQLTQFNHQSIEIDLLS